MNGQRFSQNPPKQGKSHEHSGMDASRTGVRSDTGLGVAGIQLFNIRVLGTQSCGLNVQQTEDTFGVMMT